MSNFTDEYLKEELRKICLNTINKQKLKTKKDFEKLAKSFSVFAFNIYKKISPNHDCAYFLHKAGDMYQCIVCKSFFEVTEMLVEKKEQV